MEEITRCTAEAESAKAKSKKKKNKALKIILIVVCSLLCLLMLGGVILWGVFNHYYSMLDYDQLFDEEDDFVSVELEDEEDDGFDSIDTSKLASDEEKDKFLEQLDKVDQSDKTVNAPSSDNDTQPYKLGGALGKIERNYKCEYISNTDDVINVLLIGLDSRYNVNSGLSDVMMLVSICPSQKKIVLTSFLRDVYVMIPGVGGNRLNVAYAYGGPSLLVETIEKNFGVRIDRYATTNFFTFVDVVDSIGTVKVHLNEAELSVINQHIYWNNSLIYSASPENKVKNMIDSVGAGYYELNGIQALAYARIRRIDSDFGRTSRQREVMAAMFDKVSGMSPGEWDSLLEKVLPKVKTNLTQTDILKIMLSFGMYMKYEMQTASMPPSDRFKYMKIDGRSVIGVDLDYIREYLSELIYAK